MFLIDGRFFNFNTTIKKKKRKKKEEKKNKGESKLF